MTVPVDQVDELKRVPGRLLVNDRITERIVDDAGRSELPGRTTNQDRILRQRWRNTTCYVQQNDETRASDIRIEDCERSLAGKRVHLRRREDIRIARRPLRSRRTIAHEARAFYVG